MRLIKQPNAWSCVLASAAMVLDTDCDDLIKMIGHDGSEIVLPLLPEPARRHGFHLQEIIDCAIKLDYTVTPIEVLPYSSPDGKSEFPIDFAQGNAKRLHEYMNNTKGILTGLGSRWRHAVMWNGITIYDPNGFTYSFSDCEINIDCFWFFNEIKSKF